MPHDKVIEERSHQRANIAAHLNAAHHHLQSARHINEVFGLGLDLILPDAGAIARALEVVAHKHQQETADAQGGGATTGSSS